MQELSRGKFIAIRIAKSFKKPNVAAYGYHGWHDWYLSSNLSSRNNLGIIWQKMLKLLVYSIKNIFVVILIDRLTYLLKIQKCQKKWRWKEI